MRLAALVLVACSGGPALVYPVAHTADVADTLHGERVADPYRWLEELGSPGTRAWVDAETAVTRRWLDGQSSRPAIARELAAAVDFDRTGQPKRRGTRWFFTRRTRGHGQPELVVADSPTGPTTTVIDFDRLSSDGTRAYAGFSPSPRGTYVAYGLSSGGSDWVDWHVREVATGRELPDRIAWTKYTGPSWTPDESGFYYSRFPEPARGSELVARDLGCTVRWHRLGGGGDDPIVVEDRDHRSWQFEARVTLDGRWLVVTTSDGQLGDRGVEEVHAIDLRGAASLVPIAVGFDAQFLVVGTEGTTFFVHTTLDAPTGRVI
ncbi:MAG TPA: hypothetical protein VGO00_28260, partial [Kofleriaceae bacterium]|nr:hypothetical protein [Kofleriaceae bacterium]